MILKHFPGDNSKIQSGRDFSFFHRENVLVHAKSKEISYSQHTAPLSIKTCLKGAEIYELHGIPRKVESDKFLIINNDQQYASYILSNDEVESFCLFFEDRLLDEVFAALVRKDSTLLDNPTVINSGFLFQNLEPSNAVVSFLLDNLRRTVADGFCSQLLLDEYASLILETLVRQQKRVFYEAEKLPMKRSATRLEIYRRLNLARDFMESCCDEAINLKNMARTARLSTHHFLRLFKSAFRQTPHQYLTELRLQKAFRLITENKLSVTEICLTVGFEDLSSFTRLFKRRFRLTPTEIRRKKQYPHN